MEGSRLLSAAVRMDTILSVRETRWKIIAGFLIAAMTLPLSLRLIFEENWKVVQQIEYETNGLVHPSLLFGLVETSIIVGCLFLWLGKLRVQDVGLIRSGLPIAFLSILGLWLTIQLVLVSVGWISGHQISLDGGWTQQGVLAVLGSLLGQLFGIALYEETAFRGFLLPQLYLKFSDRREKQGRKPLIWALVTSQFFFALCHLPNRLFYTANESPVIPELLVTSTVGIILAFIYLRTGNLWLIMGLHALGNGPTPIIEPLIDPNIVLTIMVVPLLLFWPRLERRMHQS